MSVIISVTVSAGMTFHEPTRNDEHTNQVALTAALLPGEDVDQVILTLQSKAEAWCDISRTSTIERAKQVFEQEKASQAQALLNSDDDNEIPS